MVGKRSFQWQDAAAPIFAVVSVLALLFRLPNPVMDLLLSVNLALSTTIFLATFFIRRPLELSSFPTILLVTTLYRLVLNVSTTRLILTQGSAGEVIDAFSRFVAGDNIVVGAVVFLIFIIIQFVVITKGATRISEVTARFTLDAMPGRQSAIDFDLNAGNITAEEAKAARDELSEQSDFFGAMDGASKFVRGDAIAGLAIVLVNLIGGLCIGVFQRHMSPSEAVALYSKLTIGDGLVSQLPAFLISIASGLLVARTSQSQNISGVMLSQTFGRPVVLTLSGFFLAFLAFTGMPTLPLLTLAAGALALAWFTARRPEPDPETTQASSRKDGAPRQGATEDEEEEVGRALRVEPLEIAIGAGLAAVAVPEEGETLLERVRRVRMTLAQQLGVVLPKTRVRDDKTLDENWFSIRVEGEERFSGALYPGMILAVDTGYALADLEGLATKSPDGRPAFWIAPDAAEKARDEGYEIMTPGDALERRLLLAARRDAASFLTRDATRRLVERLRESAPSLVEETLRAGSEPDARRLAHVQKVLRLLLRENVSIRRLDAILEALGDLSLRDPSADPWRALEYVRRRIGRSIVAPYLDPDATLHAAFFDPEGEEALRSALTRSSSGATTLTLTPAKANALVAALRSATEILVESEIQPTALVGSDIRYALHEFVRSSGIELAVLAIEEIDASTRVTQDVVVDWKGA